MLIEFFLLLQQRAREFKGRCRKKSKRDGLHFFFLPSLSATTAARAVSRGPASSFSLRFALSLFLSALLFFSSPVVAQDGCRFELRAPFRGGRRVQGATSRSMKKNVHGEKGENWGQEYRRRDLFFFPLPPSLTAPPSPLTTISSNRTSLSWSLAPSAGQAATARRLRELKSAR